MAGENDQAKGGQQGDQATAETPQRFEIGGKILSQQEAAKFIEDGIKAGEEMKNLRQQMSDLQQFRQDAEAAFMNHDVTAYKRAMKAMGKTEQDIEETVAMMQRIKTGEFPGNVNPGRTRNDEGDEGDEGDEDSPRGAQLSQAQLGTMVERITQNVMKHVQGEIDSLKKWGKNVGEHLRPMSENFYETRLQNAIKADAVLGAIADMTGEKVDYVIGQARKVLQDKLRKEGAKSPTAFEDAIAEARRVAKITGLLDAPHRRAGATPYPGSAPAVHGSTGARGQGKRREAPLLNGPNADAELMEFVNGSA